MNKLFHPICKVFELAKTAAQHPKSSFPREFAPVCILSQVYDGFAHAFQHLQDDVPSKAIGHNDISNAARQVDPLDVADEVEVVLAAQLLVGLLDHLGALAGLLGCEEGLKQALDIFLCDAGPFISYSYC